MRHTKIIITAFIHHLHRSSYCIVSVLKNSATFSITDIVNANEKCQLKFLLASTSEYSKHIDIVQIVNISVRFVRQLIK